MGVAGDGGAGCSSPSGDAGDITYNTTYDLMQYCEGDTWIPIGQAPDPCHASLSPTAGQTCRDGSIYAGLSPDGNVAMYTTPTNLSGTYPWNNAGNSGAGLVDTPLANACASSTCDTGESNTAALVTYDADSSIVGFQDHEAAKACYDLTAHGHSDWYLPADNELAVLEANDAAVNFDDSTIHWSSSEHNLGGVRTNGATRFKPTVTVVRCVRKD